LATTSCFICCPLDDVQFVLPAFVERLQRNPRRLTIFRDPNRCTPDVVRQDLASDLLGGRFVISDDLQETGVVPADSSKV
jgi:hypothetical protein